MITKQKKQKVAIQGGRGAFHELAAITFFAESKIEIVPCDTFAEVFSALENESVDYGIVAIENTVAGSILPNYAYLHNGGMQIRGEQYLRIVQNLMALPGQTLNTIQEIHSHPMAILQCGTFLEPLRKNGVKIIDSIDTALSAKWIRDNNLAGIAAIASETAAEMYGLQVLEHSIETNKRNFTRFLILSKEKHKKSGMNGKDVNKSSICFSLPHEAGCLSQVLSILAFYKMNLTKIQSLPIVGIEWEYLFYIDLMFEQYDRYKKAIKAVRPLMERIEILGEYKHGKQPNGN
jgi:prephenate dehydratase